MPHARKPKLLVVDDKDRHVELLHALLRDYDYATRCTLPGPCWECPERKGCTLTHAHDARETEEALARNPDVDVVLLDLAFDLPPSRLLPSDEPDLAKRQRYQGLAILAQLRRARADLPIVLMTSEAQLRYEDAAEKLAVDEHVTLAGESALDARALGLLVERVLARRRDTESTAGFVVGGDAAMQRLFRDARTLAKTSLPMLVTGETGTGKSALAEQVIHPATGRRGPFVAIDLGALPETLVASELFGTARGAFSGAVDREGRFERASGGTLFLDEIGNLSLELQRMLLRVLEESRVTRLGETDARAVDVKLVAATNEDLGDAVRRGTFRRDLLARLNPAASLRLPPLRERRDDVIPLAQASVRRAFALGADRELLARYADRAKVPELRAELVTGTHRGDGGVAFVLSKETEALLRAHAWPGNVRELSHVVRSAVLLALADALAALEQKRGGKDAHARLVPVPAKLVRDLLRGGALAAATSRKSGETLDVALAPGDTPHALAWDVERQIYERLFAETGGDFEAMAERLLAGDPAKNARRVRLRFNQLGLKARRSKS